MAAAVLSVKSPTKWTLAPTALALAFGIVYLILEPRPGDLAAHVFSPRWRSRAGG